MKLSVMQENLARGLQVVSRAVSSRATLPVLANVLLKTEDAGLKLTATNLEIGIRKTVPAEVSVEGSTTAPARLLTDFVGTLPDDELEISAIRAQGSGGQNVNKVANAVHLRFDVEASSALPEEIKRRIRALRDQRISSEGVIVIKAQEHRSLERNKTEALERLAELIERALARRKPRKPTKPSRAAERKRLERKSKRGELKRARSRIEQD